MQTIHALSDYAVNDRNCGVAAEHGLHNAAWYKSPIPRAKLKELMQRKDGPAIRDTIIWFGVLIVSGLGGYLTWGTWWAVPFFVVYGFVYGSSSDSRWHEAGHGTAFRTRWMNDALYQVACFMILREPTVWRWSHARHHTDTIIVGCDPEIPAARPPNIGGILLNLFALKSGAIAIKNVLIHVTGRVTEAEKEFIPQSEWPKVFRVARIWVAIYAVFIIGALAVGSILPLMYVGLPSFYGAGMVIFFGLTQHAGLAEDVLDHRLNSRTVYMNPIFRFLYWNMNYHIEHHMFPTVPYHALPKLHEAMKGDTPPPYRGTWEAYKEIIPALLRQVREPTYYVKRHLPPTATPGPDFNAVPAE